ncbi:ankyrin repeat domain-containing protein [Endozoicomonas sp. SCSIO W0465]|uniref:ankyrin repeat domain-containing protein n=1 Tax=Endozoicomonas sp. SCSIO W0465 TaxID=2918516 RepID=UPI002074D389|nr:ankyrin repeat domain-containing protein [Endozoicomonas sp. SCSIO W0465]USE34373.1 ankyrin repeat domain-containing protein [Endozoicomonas sp. SCSIO W0465]
MDNIRSFGSFLYYPFPPEEDEEYDDDLPPEEDPIAFDPILTELHEAASSGHTEACVSLLERHPKKIVNIERACVGTALHAAASNGHAETINRLIELGADPEIGFRNTPLNIAVSGGHTMAVKALLENNCNPEGLRDGGDCPGPLHQACENGNIEIARILIQAGAEVGRRDYEGLHPLHHAAGHNDPDLIRLLLDAGAEPNWLADSEHRTPLHKAATAGNSGAVKALLTGGADPDGFRVKIVCCAQMPEFNHFPPIGFAIINNHNDVVSELVQSNADLKPPIKIREAIEEVDRKKSFFDRIEETADDRRKLLGKFELNHPVFDDTMEPIEYSVCTEKTEIIGRLMMSSKYSNNDIDDLIRLTEIHELTRSRQAINEYACFIPPESLQVLAGRSVKQIIKENFPEPEQNARIKKLLFPDNLEHFLLQPIDINKPKNS